MKRLNLMLKSLLAIAVVALIAGMWVGPAAAAGPTNQQREYRALKYGLSLLEIRVKALQDQIDLARDGIAVADQFIQDEQANGQDTSALEAALTTFETKLANVQSLHDEAAQILATKAGFDQNGNVTDPAQARETLKNAHQKVQEATQTLREARQEFRRAMQEYRQNKRNQ